MRIRRILVPTDFSRASLKAVDYAADLAASVGAEIVLLYVEDTNYALPELIYDGPAAARVMEEAHRAAQHQLAELGERQRKSGIKVHVLLRVGPAAATILRAAEKLRADWIVVGTHGRTGRGHTLLGSVAERVIQGTSCPVITVPSRRPPVRSPRHRARDAAP